MPSPPEATVVLPIGPAAEDWTGDARFHEYTAAVDPEAVGAITPVPVRRFSPAVHADAGTGLVLLDCADDLGTPYPATSPGLLAAFLVLAPGATVPGADDATSELLVCLRGSGWTSLRPPGGGPPARLDWAAGDFVVLPAGWDARHTGGDPGPEGEPALCYRVTDAPLLAYLGAAPALPRFRPTRFGAAEARAALAAVEADPAAATRNRISVLLGNAATPRTLTVTHTLWAMFGVLPVGAVQRPHRHQSAALDLILECEPGCYSLVGEELDAEGHIVDPVRVDWEAHGAFVTPPGRWHSHHNASGAPALLVPIQDAGLHTYLRSLDIRFAPTVA